MSVVKLYEFEGKELFRQYGIPIPSGKVISNMSQIDEVIDEIGFPMAIKAQVLVGGRGKAGGIKIVDNFDDAKNFIKKLFEEGVAGIPVKYILVEEAVNIDRELYLSITIDRSERSYVVLASTEGGVDIEEIAAKYPDKIIKRNIDPFIGLRDYDIRAITKRLGLSREQGPILMDIIKGLYRMFIELDADLVEINPLAVTKDGKLLALDSKVIIDDNAIFRHLDIASQERITRDLTETERIAKQYGFSYVELDGDIGIIGNGAGLTMATMDLVYSFGGKPANFLDIGGGARKERVKEAVKLLLRKPRIRAIFINIFGGITRCDEVALGIIEAIQEVEVKKPLIIRLVGTNEEEGRKILMKTGVKCYDNDEEAAKEIVKLVSSG